MTKAVRNAVLSLGLFFLLTALMPIRGSWKLRRTSPPCGVRWRAVARTTVCISSAVIGEGIRYRHQSNMPGAMMRAKADMPSFDR